MVNDIYEKFGGIFDSEGGDMLAPVFAIVESTYTDDIQGYLNIKCGMEWLYEAESKIDRLYLNNIIGVW